jgi:hypothetical protein
MLFTAARIVPSAIASARHDAIHASVARRPLQWGSIAEAQRAGGAGCGRLAAALLDVALEVDALDAHVLAHRVEPATVQPRRDRLGLHFDGVAKHHAQLPVRCRFAGSVSA